MNEDVLNGLEGLEGMEGLEGLQGMEGMEMMGSDTMQTIMMANAFSGVVQLAFYLLAAWGLYMLAKKMNLKRAWMSWVPILQYYPMAQAGSKSVMTHFVYPILGMIASFFAMGILGGLGGSTGGLIGGLLVFLAAIYMLVKFVQVLSGISKNTGRGGWTTAGLFFVGFIMFPVVGHKYKGGENKKSEEEVGMGETVVDEVKEEL